MKNCEAVLSREDAAYLLRFVLNFLNNHRESIEYDASSVLWVNLITDQNETRYDFNSSYCDKCWTELYNLIYLCTDCGYQLCPQCDDSVQEISFKDFINCAEADFDDKIFDNRAKFRRTTRQQYKSVLKEDKTNKQAHICTVSSKRKLVQAKLIPSNCEQVIIEALDFFNKHAITEPNPLQEILDSPDNNLIEEGQSSFQANFVDYTKTTDDQRVKLLSKTLSNNRMLIVTNVPTSDITWKPKTKKKHNTGMQKGDGIDLNAKQEKFYQDNSPCQKYSTVQGSYNLAHCLPKQFNGKRSVHQVFEGNKDFNQSNFESADDNKLKCAITKCSTVIQANDCDTVDILWYVETKSLNQQTLAICEALHADTSEATKLIVQDKKIGAVVTVIDPTSFDEMIRFLEKRSVKLFRKPNFILNHATLTELKANGIRFTSVIQCRGDAVFIPAGAIYQIVNINKCIKSQMDFVSPERLEYTWKITQQHRQNHMQDTQHVKSMVYHTAKEILKTFLDTDASTADDL